jgi:hypothetical protein
MRGPRHGPAQQGVRVERRVRASSRRSQTRESIKYFTGASRSQGDGCVSISGSSRSNDREDRWLRLSNARSKTMPSVAVNVPEPAADCGRAPVNQFGALEPGPELRK